MKLTGQNTKGREDGRLSKTGMDPKVSLKQSIGSTVLHELSGGNVSKVLLSDGTVLEVFWVTVEGVIGAGKSTLIEKLLPRFRAIFGENRVFFVPENEQLLKSQLFNDYCADPKRWAYQFQTVCFNRRTEGEPETGNGGSSQRHLILVLLQTSRTAGMISWKRWPTH